MGVSALQEALLVCLAVRDQFAVINERTDFGTGEDTGNLGDVACACESIFFIDSFIFSTNLAYWRRCYP